MLRFPTVLLVSISSFSWIGVHVCKFQQFCWVCEKKNKKKNEDIFFQKFVHISEMADLIFKFSLNLKCGYPWVEDTSSVNFMPFGLRLHMRKIVVFFLSIHLWCCVYPFFWAELHTTVCLDYIFENMILGSQLYWPCVLPYSIYIWEAMETLPGWCIIFDVFSHFLVLVCKAVK